MKFGKEISGFADPTFSMKSCSYVDIVTLSDRSVSSGKLLRIIITRFLDSVCPYIVSIIVNDDQQYAII